MSCKARTLLRQRAKGRNFTDGRAEAADTTLGFSGVYVGLSRQKTDGWSKVQKLIEFGPISIKRKRS